MKRLLPVQVQHNSVFCCITHNNLWFSPTFSWTKDDCCGILPVGEFGKEEQQTGSPSTGTLLETVQEEKKYQKDSQPSSAVGGLLSISDKENTDPREM